MRTLSILAMTAALAGCVESEVVTGRRDFQAMCASCHGDAGRGDGPLAGGLEAAPSDLTTISARNGGVFPFTDVMGQIDGYGRGQHYTGAMPEFWPVMEGDLVVVETDPGIMTPTPKRLVALAAYIESIQE